jgi:carboxylesterase type B
VPIATIADEVRRAARWIVREGAAHGAHPDRIVVGGHSAGGHLTRCCSRPIGRLRLRRATVREAVFRYRACTISRRWCNSRRTTPI